jgi:HAE1 family hydrophobic/amphiphilic exporter-1
MLPISVLPNIEFPTIQVSVSLPGADPDTMASAVALPLENQFSSIASIDSISSTNTTGSTQITLQFDLDRDIDAAAGDVQSAISLALKQLPTTLPFPPTYRKVNPASAPVFYLACTSGAYTLSKVDDYAENLIAKQLSMLDGVAQVQVYGSQQYAVRIQMDPLALAADKLGLDEVVNAISNNNVNLPSGSLYGKDTYSNIITPGQLKTPEEYNNLILTYRNGAPIMLKNVGQAIDSVVNDKIASWYNDKRAIILAVQKQPSSNTIEVTDSIKNLLPKLKKQIPPGIEINTLFDRSISIRDSVSDVEFTLILALILVVMVIFFFLDDLRSTIIPSLSLPLAIMGTFPLMYLLKFSIDNLSLLALTLAVGFVVDDAIVVLENITRHLEMGKARLQAALEGTKEIIFTIISMTSSLIAVFIPLLFMAGILGRLLHELAVTIAIAILLSGIISITITPALCNFFLVRHHENASGLGVGQRLFEYLKNKYRDTLLIVLDHQKTTIIIFLLVTVSTAVLFGFVPKGFLPDEDSGQIMLYTEASEKISFEAMVKQQKLVADILLKNPYIDAFASTVGPSGRSTSMNQGSIFLTLQPYSQRPKAAEIIKDLRDKLSNVIGMKVYIQNVATITIGGQSSKSQYQYTLQGIDQDELFEFVPKLVSKLQTIPGFIDVTSDLQLSQPQTLIEVDRYKAAELGISLAAVQKILYSAYGSQQISTIYSTTAQYQVIMEMDPKYQTDASMLSSIYLKSANGNMIPLEAIAKTTSTVGPLTIAHFGLLPSVTVSFNLQPGYSLSTLVPKLEAALEELKMPQAIIGGFQGTAKAYQGFLGSMGILIGLAILVIYIILGILYESFIHPLTILSGLPTAGIGALLTLMVFGKELDMYGFVGMIMLVGIVKKNAIIIIDFALEAQKTTGKNPRDAVFEACIVRFRPIMMTTMAALMGALPIALGIGATGETRSSLGLVVVGGLCTSQLLTLYITPVIFLYFEKAKEWVNSRRGSIEFN